MSAEQVCGQCGNARRLTLRFAESTNVVCFRCDGTVPASRTTFVHLGDGPLGGRVVFICQPCMKAGTRHPGLFTSPDRRASVGAVSSVEELRRYAPSGGGD